MWFLVGSRRLLIHTLPQSRPEVHEGIIDQECRGPESVIDTGGVSVNICAILMQHIVKVAPEEITRTMDEPLPVERLDNE